MINKNFIKIIKSSFVLSMCITLSACSFNNSDKESVIYGEINTEKEYVEENNVIFPSLVERSEKIDINNYFNKIPISITSEKIESTLPDIYGNPFTVNRIQLNGVDFDINEIANMSNYDYYIEDGFLKIRIPIDENMIEITVVQLAQGNTYFFTDDTQREVSNIVLEYSEIYENSKEQVSGEYGNYYTYDKYIKYLNEHEDLKKEITVYDKDQVLELLIDTFKLENYKTSDFLSNNYTQTLEYSEWYEVCNDYFSAKEENYSLSMAVKRNEKGVFAIMVKYPNDCTVDQLTKKDYFTPTMIINFAQNNYQQLAESYNDYVERTQK